MNRYLKETRLLDFTNPIIIKLVKQKGWKQQCDKEKIKNIYNYVRDDIKFGYNLDDAMQSSLILKDGYGQCNTKGILFMSLLRAVGIPCRIHGFIIDKELQKGVLTGIWYRIAPVELIHTWVEAYYNRKWYDMEGVILDINYLSRLEKIANHCSEGYCGYGVSTEDLVNPKIDWDESNTYIQKASIKRDLGVYDDPDTFFKKHHQHLNFIKKFIYRNIVRHIMNKNVASVRNLNND